MALSGQQELLQVKGLTKTFKLSSKQQKLEKTKEKVRTAVNDLSFTAYKGEIFGLLGPNVPRYEQKTLSIT